MLRKITASVARGLIADLGDDYFNVEESIEAEVFDYSPRASHYTTGSLAHLYLLVGRLRIPNNPTPLLASSETIAWITPDKRFVVRDNNRYRYVLLEDVIRTLNSYECGRLIYRLRGNYDSIIRSYLCELTELRRAQVTS